MSRFYGSVQGSGGRTSTRCGHKTTGIDSHTRGWEVGIRVCGNVQKGKDVFDVYITSGREHIGGHRPMKQKLLGTFTAEEIQEVFAEDDLKRKGI